MINIICDILISVQWLRLSPARSSNRKI